jgi:hypothetical protein
MFGYFFTISVIVWSDNGRGTAMKENEGDG